MMATALRLAQLDQELRRNHLHAAYALLGSDAYLRQSAEEMLVAAVLRADASCAVRRLHAKEHRVDALLEAAQSLDLFAGAQLALVHDVDAWKSEALLRLAEFLQQPHPGVTFLLCGEKLDMRTKGAKALQAAVAVVQCKPLYPREVPDWVRMTVRQRGREISRGVVDEIIQTIGHDLQRLAQAIDHLLLFIGEARMIESTHVSAVLMTVPPEDIFALTRAVGAQQPAQATARLEALLQCNEPPVRLAAMITRHWRLLMRAAAWQQGGAQSEGKALAQALRVHPFFAQKYADQAQNLGLTRLRRGLPHLAQCDRLLKRTQRHPRAVLTNCLLQLCMV
jgi:DNA polymerase III subunit delta